MHIHIYVYIMSLLLVYMFPPASSESRGRRQGYMGHLMKMVNLLVRCGETDQSLAAMIQDTMEEELQQRWNHFLSSTVADSNRKNETNLVGGWVVTRAPVITDKLTIELLKV